MLLTEVTEVTKVTEVTEVAEVKEVKEVNYEYYAIDGYPLFRMNRGNNKIERYNYCKIHEYNPKNWEFDPVDIKFLRFLQENSESTNESTLNGFIYKNYYGTCVKK